MPLKPLIHEEIVMEPNCEPVAGNSPRLLKSFFDRGGRCIGEVRLFSATVTLPAESLARFGPPVDRWGDPCRGSACC
jgi:hypothetical protein